MPQKTKRSITYKNAQHFCRRLFGNHITLPFLGHLAQVTRSYKYGFNCHVILGIQWGFGCSKVVNPLSSHLNYCPSCHSSYFQSSDLQCELRFWFDLAFTMSEEKNEKLAVLHAFQGTCSQRRVVNFLPSLYKYNWKDTSGLTSRKMVLVLIHLNFPLISSIVDNFSQIGFHSLLRRETAFPSRLVMLSASIQRKQA